MLFFHAAPQSLAAGHKKETSKNPHIHWLPPKSSFSNCHCMRYNLPTKYQRGLFVPWQTEPMVRGNVTSTAGLCWEMAPHCWCVQWVHVRADPAVISPGTPAGCCQWLDSASWHLSQLHGVHHRRPLPRYLNTLHKTLQNLVRGMPALASTLCRLSHIHTHLLACMKMRIPPLQTADGHTWCLTTRPEGRGCLHRQPCT